MRTEFFNVIALDATGAIIANLNDRRALGSGNFSKRAYFFDTVQSHEGIISAPFRSTLSQQPVVAVTEPVYDAAGKLRYILVGAIDLHRPSFFGQLEALKQGKSGYLFMLTRDGTIIHHPDKNRVLMNVKQEQGGPVPSTLAALNGFEGWTVGPTKRCVYALITYKRLSSTDWILGAVYPVEEAFAPLIALRAQALFASGAVAIVAGLLGWLAVWRLLRPLNALRRHTAGIAEGNCNIDVFDVPRRDEFGELSRAFYALSKKRRDAENALVTVARTDSLTGLHNRRFFEESMTAGLARARRNHQALALAYLDIDCFKLINDTYGHGVGDEVLIEFSRRLAQVVRVTDTVARLAGDEFVVILESLVDAHEAALVAQKIVDKIACPFALHARILVVTTSVGIAVNADGTATRAAMMTASDAALYDAKRSGKNDYRMRVV